MCHSWWHSDRDQDDEGYEQALTEKNRRALDLHFKRGKANDHQLDHFQFVKIITGVCYDG